MAATRTDPQWPRLAFSTQAARAILRERHRKEGTERKTARRGVSTERKHARTQHLKGEREKEKKERKKERILRTSGRPQLVFARASERKKERKKVCTQRLSFFQNLSKTPPSLDDDALRAGRRRRTSRFLALEVHLRRFRVLIRAGFRVFRVRDEIVVARRGKLKSVLCVWKRGVANGYVMMLMRDATGSAERRRTARERDATKKNDDDDDRRTSDPFVVVSSN